MYRIMTSLMMILSVFLTSCCAMTRDQASRITVTAEQSNAEVFIDGYDCGTAPLLVDLDKAYDHTIIVAKPGYQPQEACLKSHHTLESGFNLATPGIGALIGAGVTGLVWGSGYNGVGLIIGTLIGGGIGLGVGALGLAADLYSRSDCDLDIHAVHFNLIENDLK